MNDIIMKVLRKIKEPRFCGVLDDLVAFTGMTEESVCEHIVASNERVKREFKHVAPKGPVENELFYRCCREYLFLNAYREVWPKMVQYEDLLKEPILDFAGGMGNDSVWLARRGYTVSYHEISIVQREFMRFRVARNSVNVHIADMYVDRYEPFKWLLLEYRTVMFRDVLEHAPNYEGILKAICPKIARGGLLLEHTLWAGLKERKNPLHLNEKKPLGKILAGLGFKSEGRGVWRKRG